VRSVTGRHDEQGSIVFVALLLMVLSLVASTLFYRVAGDGEVVASRQGGAAAVSLADAGLADALFRIDQEAAGTGGSATFCVGAPGCLAASIPAAPGASYVATASGPTKWTVESVATTGGQSAAVEEQVTRSSKYPFALFGETSLTFNGSAGQAFATYDPAQPATSSNPDPTGEVTVGSNGPINCNGGLGSNVTVVYYGTGGVGSSQSSNCGRYQSNPDTYYLAPPSPPADALPCPDGGLMGSAIAGAPSSLAAGSYLCTTPVTISGVLDVDGPVQLYVMLDPTLYGSTTGAITITSGSYVNDQADYCAANGGCSPAPDLPASQDFQLFTNATGTVGNSNGSGFWFGGIVYAPDASLTADGCKSVYYGSLTINTLTCNAGPHLTVYYDETLATDYGPWAASDYTQVNPSSVTIP